MTEVVLLAGIEWGRQELWKMLTDIVWLWEFLALAWSRHNEWEKREMEKITVVFEDTQAWPKPFPLLDIFQF